VQGEHGALRNNEEAPQLGEPRDDVMGKSVGKTAARRIADGVIQERHHRDGGAPRRRSRPRHEITARLGRKGGVPDFGQGGAL
jgi:hypothetical protein